MKKRSIALTEGKRSPWIPLTVHASGLELNGRRLLLTLTPVKAGWEAVAIETSVESRDTAAVMKEHSHCLLGSRASLHAAKKLADRFMDRWAKERSSPAPACDCAPIKTARRRAAA